jgi:hypothetical protein
MRMLDGGSSPPKRRRSPLPHSCDTSASRAPRHACAMDDQRARVRQLEALSLLASKQQSFGSTAARGVQLRVINPSGVSGNRAPARRCRRSGQLCMCNLSSHPVDPGDSGPSRRVAFAEGTAGVGDLALKRLPGTYRRHGESPAFAGDLRRGVQVRVKCESRGPTRCHLSNWPERQHLAPDFWQTPARGCLDFLLVTANLLRT